MRYFLIKTDRRVSDAPNIINWVSKINPAYLKVGSYYKIDNRTVLEIESNKNTVFTEIITFPFLLISKKIKEIIAKYEPTLKYKEIILLDSDNNLMQVYYMPILEEIDCLTEGTVFNLDHSVIEHGVIQRNKVGECSIFSLAEVKNRYIAVRLDVLESILRRDAIVTVKELEVR
ncbi:hypothetical protein acsn021_06140 [Anaerocolumna cellulosilytica]|uniref:Uncharacterized protein n=1 Tax=Anaerocolumna cellulosilytica TaxID=433286 RepID=A0A6S6R0A6_9FIRM|nr:hypothetical protein [Anaerocolumna cellulosilytica]MBB5197743.1 hypothetical protein [Anaerocolumna cellulosilytica]BCJ93045.1 hypothetical protein acsn021_06140 [Anaerocolumna cellulosilytica]